MIYLDHAATTPVRPEVAAAMEPFLADRFGNPSGVHATAQAARAALEDAREEVADLLGARPLDVVFTSGGTEADNLAIKGAVFARPGGVVTTSIEHAAVLESVRFLCRLGYPATEVGVARDGSVDPAAVGAAVDAGTTVVSVMTANNELGTIQPVAAIAAAARAAKADVLFHTDAVQAFNACDVRLDTLDADMVALSAHKFGGPKGVGVLAMRRGTRLEPILHGGGQELGRRSGTHNVAGAVGFATAARLAAAERAAYASSVTALRDRLQAGLLTAIPGSKVNAGAAPRLPGHLHISFPGVEGELLLVRLDRAGVCASAGSACHSGALSMSHVCAAIGLSEADAAGSVRLTLGRSTTEQDVDGATAVIAEAVGQVGAGALF